MPSTAERKLIASLEDQAALINRYLDRLMRDLGRAATVAARTQIQVEIDYQLGELTRVHAERADAQRRLAQSEGKHKKKGGDA